MRPVVLLGQHLVLEGQQKGHRGQAFSWCCQLVLVFKGLLPPFQQGRSSEQHSYPAWCVKVSEHNWKKDGLGRWSFSMVALRMRTAAISWPSLLPILETQFLTALSIRTGAHASFPTGQVTSCSHFRLERVLGTRQVLSVQTTVRHRPKWNVLHFGGLLCTSQKSQGKKQFLLQLSFKSKQAIFTQVFFSCLALKMENFFVQRIDTTFSGSHSPSIVPIWFSPMIPKPALLWSLVTSTYGPALILMENGVLLTRDWFA